MVLPKGYALTGPTHFVETRCHAEIQVHQNLTLTIKEFDQLFGALMHYFADARLTMCNL